MPDGNPLDMIPRAVANRVREHLETGSTPLRAWQAGGELLAIIVQTALSDPSRMAKAVAGLARPRTLYVRMLRPPSCSRCAVLAGKRGHWEAPFQRHPGCDCTQVPVAADAEVTFEGPAFDPKAFFESLPESEQSKIFTIHGAEAIREGADVAAVVNSRSGMSSVDTPFTTAGATNRGRAMRYHLGKDGLLRGRPMFGRLSVPQIIRQTEGDPQRRIAQLYRHGYLRDVAPGEKLDEVLAALRGSAGVPPIKPPPGKPPVALGGPGPEPFRYLKRTVARVADDSLLLEQVSTAVRPEVPGEVFTTFAISASGTWTERLWRIQGEEKDKPRLHEWASFVRLASNDHEVVLLPRSEGKSPDILLDGQIHEVKTPESTGKNTINNQLRLGARQSRRLVLDLLRTEFTTLDVVDMVQRSEKRYAGKIDHIVIIGRDGQEVLFRYEQ